MGVVYKLKKEIVDFIVDQKRSDPRISCRSLTELIRGRFAIEVSKSSVSAVMKEFSLSSPVGRHSSKKTSKNFFIPEEKKSALLAQVSPFLPDRPSVAEGERQEVNTGEPGEAQPLLTVSASGPGPARSPQDLPEPEPGDDAPLTLMPDPVGRYQEEEAKAVQEAMRRENEDIRSAMAGTVRQARIWGDDRGELYPNAGIIIVLAAFWSHFRSPLLGDFLARECGVPSEHRESEFLEAVVAASLLPAGDMGDPLSGIIKTLAGIYGVFPGRLAECYGKVTGKQFDLPRLSLFFQTAMASALQKAEAVELVLSSGRRLGLDPFSFALKENESVPADVRPSLYQLAETLADTYVNNTVPFIFEYSFQDGPFSKEAEEYWTALEGGETYVDSVNVVLSDGRRMPLFERLARIKRGFVAVGRLSEKDRLAVSFEQIGAERTFYDAAMDREFVYAQGSIQLKAFQGSLKVIECIERTTKEKIIFITNITKNIKNDELIGLIIKRKPLLLEKDDYLIDIAPPEPIEINNIRESDPLIDISSLAVLNILSSFLFHLMKDCSRARLLEFWNYAITVPGYIKIDPLGIMVRLVVAADHPLLADIKRVTKEINKIFINDYNYRKIIIKID
jgi:hypothetical protein